jgi:hypothetical protein
VPGGSLVEGQDVSWAKNAGAAEAGRQGEVVVGQALNRLVADSAGGVAIHDLRVPIPGFTANIDHVVVAGARVLMIDAKRWKPGFYYSFGSRAYRGFFDRCAHIEKNSMATAHKAMVGYLRRIDAAAVIDPLVVPTSSGTGRVWCRLLRVPGATPMGVGRMSSTVSRLLTAWGPADPQVVARLLQLLPDGQAPDLSTGTGPTSGTVPDRTVSSYWDGAPMSLSDPLPTADTTTEPENTKPSL